jgi:hypothetical protein
LQRLAADTIWHPALPGAPVYDRSSVPQYGGYCAYGTAKGKKLDGDPRLCKVVDDKFYFGLNPVVYKKWLVDPHGFIKQTDENWPKFHDKQPAALW